MVMLWELSTFRNWARLNNVKRACGYQTVSLVAELGSKVLAKVNSPWPNRPLVIALHSPSGLLETGLRVCPLEKSQDKSPFAVGQSILSSPVCGRNITKYGHVSGVLGLEKAKFLCC
jgi:hypothetical protein